MALGTLQIFIEQSLIQNHVQRNVLLDCTYLGGHGAVATQKVRTDAGVLVDLLVQIQAVGFGAKPQQVVTARWHFGQCHLVVEQTVGFITVAFQESVNKNWRGICVALDRSNKINAIINGTYLGQMSTNLGSCNLVHFPRVNAAHLPSLR